MDKSAPKRVAVLGGTFDPIHQGHLVFARAAHAALGLDRLIFMVAARPPHKPGCKVASFAHRLAMARLAVAAEPCFTVSDLEGRRGGPSYSVDTMREVRREQGENARLFFLVGSDAFLEMADWKEYRLLPQLATVVVAHRPGPEFSFAATVKKVFGGDCIALADGSWLLPKGGKVREIIIQPLAISSTTIRKTAMVGTLKKDLLPAEVAAYIKKHRLYKG